ncbi:hypothetical protein JTE90_018124 [Oedothorax gibbosus]|uniref:Copper transport protein ATOX1 n=1 Tax=Oedothorax gibbosus TaxID=931172 RepID=A0AAV6UZ19_9ARAC|nr:hypothetical protein JTE90_018124 [Oedothorax gibbosus]
MSTQIYEFHVEIHCENCTAAVRKVVGKLKGTILDDFTVDLETQILSVTSSMSPEKIMEKFQNKGLECTYIRIKE